MSSLVEFQGKNSLLTKENPKSHLTFAKTHFDDPQQFLENIL